LIAIPVTVLSALFRQLPEYHILEEISDLRDEFEDHEWLITFPFIHGIGLVSEWHLQCTRREYWLFFEQNPGRLESFSHMNAKMKEATAFHHTKRDGVFSYPDIRIRGEVIGGYSYYSSKTVDVRGLTVLGRHAFWDRDTEVKVFGGTWDDEEISNGEYLAPGIPL
jgi:hypothetical protein